MAKITTAQVTELKNLLHHSCTSWVFSSADTRKIVEALKHQFNIVNLADIDEDQYYEVMDFIDTVRMQIMKITVVINDLKEHSFRQCILGGAPLTGILVRKYRAQLDDLPPIINWAQMQADLDTVKKAAKAALEVSHA